MQTKYMEDDAGRLDSGRTIVQRDCMLRAVKLSKGIATYDDAYKVMRLSGWRLRGGYKEPVTGLSMRIWGTKATLVIMSRLGFTYTDCQAPSNLYRHMDFVPNCSVICLMGHVVYKDNRGFIRDTWDSRYVNRNSWKYKWIRNEFGLLRQPKPDYAKPSRVLGWWNPR